MSQDELAVGDRVWWNEGVAIGYIREVLATPAQWEAWGLTESTLIIAQTRDPAVPSGTIGEPMRMIADEGIGVLTAVEAELADAALEAAARHWGETSVAHLGISCAWSYGRLLHWTVVRYGGDTFTAVRLPPGLAPVEPVAEWEVSVLLRPNGGGRAE